MPDLHPVVPLGPAFLSSATALQDAVLASLGQDEAHYLVPKSRAQFWHYLHGHGAIMYGIASGMQHAAQLVVRHRVDAHEDSRNRAAVAALGNYLLLQGLLTHPHCRGQGLAAQLLAHVEKTHPGATLLARVVPDNAASWSTFLKSGFVIAAAEHDPDDERRVFYMQKSAPVAGSTMRSVERHEFTACQTLCREGWRGVAYNRGTESIEFTR